METIRDYRGDRYIVVGRGPIRPADHPHAQFIMPYAVWGEKTTPGPGYRTETTNQMRKVCSPTTALESESNSLLK